MTSSNSGPTSPTNLPSTAGLMKDPLHNPELCMRPGDLAAKEGEVFAIKKFKPDKEGDVMTYAGISQSGAREIMASSPISDISMREIPYANISVKQRNASSKYDSSTRSYTRR